MKARWATNADRAELTEFWLKLFIRSDYSGNTLVQHESGSPLYSYAPELKYEDGTARDALGWSCVHFSGTANGFRPPFNVVEMIRYHDNGLSRTPFPSLVLTHWALILNSSKHTRR